MIVGGGHGLLHEVLGVHGVGRARILGARGARLAHVGPGAAAAPGVIGRRCPALEALARVQLLMVAAVRLLVMLLLFMMMMMMLLMLLRVHRGPRAPVQPRIPGVRGSHGAAVTSRAFNGSRGAGGPRVERPGGHREALVLLQRVVLVQMVVIRVVTGRAGARSVTDGVFHKRVHVVH